MLRPTEGLWVHVPCGELRGMTELGEQRCTCQARQDRWPGWDVSEIAQLCVVCVRGTAGGPTRWSWLACGNCRQLNEALGVSAGRGPLPLGRHSIMHGVAHRIAGASARTTEAFSVAVQSPTIGWDELMRWRQEEVQRLSAGAGISDEVLLREWGHRFPAGDHESRDALRRLLSITSFNQGG